MQSPGLLLVVAILSLSGCGDDKGDATSDALTTSGSSSSTDTPGSTGSSGTPSTGEPSTGTPTTGEPATTTGEPVTGTGTDSSGGESSSGSTTTGAVGLSLAADVYPVWNPPIRCDCHNNGTGGLTMVTVEEAYMNLVGVPANGAPLNRVEPGSAVDSYIWHKISGTQVDVGGGGQQMPLGAPPLDQSTIDLIAQWIDEGANP